ncbi:MAG TPA: Stf0 family sulfotransferase [Trebonia sp.]
MTAYIIACTPRTGSWLLCDCLRQAGSAGLPGEYGTRQDTATWQDFYGFRTHRQYFDSLIGLYASGNGVIGIKFMWWQFDAFGAEAATYLGAPGPAFALLRRVIGPYRVLFLRRRDTTRQAVSWARAIQTNRWSRQAAEQGKPRPDADPSADSCGAYDGRLVLDCWSRIRAHNRCWQDALSSACAEPYELWYEDLATDPVAGTLAFLDFLDIAPAAATFTPRLTRQADTLTEQWVQRAREDLRAGCPTPAGD